MDEKYNTTGVSCEILRVKNETEQYHKKLEILFLISGLIRVVIEEKEFLLAPEETLLINSYRKHYIYADEKSLFLRIYVSYEMLKSLFDEEYVLFCCNHLTDSEVNYKELRNYFREIVWLIMEGEKNEGFLLLEQVAKVLNFLTRNYKVERKDVLQSSTISENDRVQEVLDYINYNYHEPVSLNQMADRICMSASKLSRLFKKATGISFPDYVNKLRVYHATDDLLKTNNSMTEIAMDNGFSSPSYFNRVFRDYYGTSPSQYKKTVQTTSEKESGELTAEETGRVQKYLEEHRVQTIRIEEDHPIVISGNSERVFHHIYNRAVSLGAFSQLSNSSVQNQIRRIIENLHLDYIRVWNIFSPQCMIADSPEEKNLSFEQVDVVLDFLVDLHVHPFLDMTYHPECLVKNGRKLFFSREDSIGFENIEQWSYFLDQLMSHVVFRYGREEISHWIFEFGDYNVNTGMEYYEEGFDYYENNQYKDVFLTAYQIIKSYCKDTMVGGPEWVLHGKALDLTPQFEVFRAIGVYPDFYSVHIFPYINATYSEMGSDMGDSQNMDPDFMRNQIYDFHNKLKSMNAPARPIFVTESTTILSNRNAMNDHCARGTNVLRICNIFQNYADMVIFWVATDRLSLHYAPANILHGGSGLMSKDGIPKPSYFALYFLGKLGNKLLEKGPGYIAVQNEPENIYILCYNHKNLILDYKYEEENMVNVHNVNSMFVNKEPLQFKFLVQDLTAGGEYVVKRHIVNQDYGSVMDEWSRLGYESQMRQNDIDYMKSICVPKIKMEHRIAENGRLLLEVELQAHEMLLLHIYR